LISVLSARLRVTAIAAIGQMLFLWSPRQTHGAPELHLLPSWAVRADQRAPISLFSAVLILRQSTKTGGGEGHERRRWRQPHLPVRKHLREIESADQMSSKRMTVVEQRPQSRLPRIRTLRSKLIIPNVMNPLALRARLAPGRRADLRSRRRQVLCRSRLFALSTMITTKVLLMP
jgi:hypothetical protein